jgi:hypothetical protein
MSEETLPESVLTFLDTHPAVLDWEVIPEKIKCLNVILKDKRDLIKFPSEYEGYRFYASLPEIKEENPFDTPASLIETQLVPEVEDEIKMETDLVEMAATAHKVPKTDAELRQLAMDIVENKVFTDRHLNENEASMLGQVFMPIIFMSEEQTKKVFEDVGMVYEYYSEAGPRGINGLPVFMTVRFLSSDESNRIAPMIKTIQEFKRQFLGKKEENNEPTVTCNTGQRDTEEQSDKDVLPLSDVSASEAVEQIA